MDQKECVVMEERKQGSEPGRRGYNALQGLEHHLAEGPAPLGGPPSGHHPTTTSSWWEPERG